MELQGSESVRRYAQVSFVAWNELQIGQQTSKSAEPRIGKIVARAICGPPRRVHFSVWLYWYRTSFGFAAALSQIADEFLTRVELRARRLVPIEIADETNAKRDIVQIIAMHMTAINLTPPAIADLDLAVTGGCAVADDEVIGEAVLHPANMLVIIVKDARIALPSAAIVHDDKLPPPSFDRCPPDRIDHRTR